MTTTFTGFDEHTFRFLRALARDNSRATFEAHREAYEAHCVAPGRAFVEAAAPHLARLAPGLVADPRIGGSLVRMRRDARFVGEGSPYRERLELWFWEGPRQRAVSLLTLTLAPGEVRVGAGARGLRGDVLAAYRAAIAEATLRAELDRLMRSLVRAEFEVSGPELGAVPASLQELGLEPGTMAEALARRRSLEATVALDPALARSPELVPRAVAVWKRVAGLHRWLVDHVQSAAA